MTGLSVTHEATVARIVFDRAPVLNALSPDMLRALVGVCTELESNDEVRVVCLEGAGACFSAGADLPAFLGALQGPEPRSVADLGRRATEALAMLPQITIAGIRGHCIGGGLVLAGACDLRLASDDARFAIPELDAGIPLGWGGLGHLVRLVGETVAADWVLSCRPFDAREAHRTGLVSRVVPSVALEGVLSKLARAIASKPAHVLRVTKRQLLGVRAGSFDTRLDADAMLESLNDPEAIERSKQYVARHLSTRRVD